jgi:hypothetical protein
MRAGQLPDLFDGLRKNGKDRGNIISNEMASIGKESWSATVSAKSTLTA